MRKGQDATYTTLEGSLSEDLARRGLHLHFDNLEEWAPEYAEAGAGVLDQVREHEHSSTIHSPNIVIRVFSADAPAALHGDGNTQVNCGVGADDLYVIGPDWKQRFEKSAPTARCEKIDGYDACVVDAPPSPGS